METDNLWPFTQNSTIFFLSKASRTQFSGLLFKLYFNIILSYIRIRGSVVITASTYRMVSLWLEYRHKKEWSLLGVSLTDSGLAQSPVQRISRFVLGDKVSGKWRLLFLPSIKAKNEQKQRYTWNSHMCRAVLTRKNFTYNLASRSLRQLLKLPYL
jgi:hypothetical protein